MGILLLDLEPEPGLSFTETLACALGDDVCVACPGESELARRLDSRAMQVFMLPEGKAWGFSVLSALRRFLREGSITLLHSRGHQAALAASLLLRKGGLPWVHSLNDGNARQLGAWRYRRANALIFDSEHARGRAAVPPALKCRCEVCLPGLDLRALRARHPRGDGRFVFLVSAPLGAGGGVDTLLQAMAHLKNMGIELPPWEVRVNGEGPDLPTLLEAAHNLGVDGPLCLLGRQDRRALYPDADAVVSPLGEGGDMTGIMEAWQAGLPVVCTALPNHEEIVQDKVSALLVSPGNPVALAGAMLRLLQEEDLRLRLVQGGRKAAENYTPAMLAARYRALYERLAGGAPPSHSQEDV